MTSTQQMSKAKVWWQALRYHFVPPSIFPAVLGGLVSWATDAGFIPLYFLLVLVAIIINHIGLNMTDDYYDYKHSVDKLKPGEKNPYTGGSGTLSSGLLSPKNMFKAFTFCYLFTMAMGVYLTLTRGLPILAFGLIGVFCAVFYTAPPISFGHHGLGELAYAGELWLGNRFRRVLCPSPHLDAASVSGNIASGNYAVLDDCHKRNSRRRRRPRRRETDAGGKIRKKSRRKTLHSKLDLHLRGNHRISGVSDPAGFHAYCFGLFAACLPFNQNTSTKL